MKNKIKIAVVGIGLMGNQHLKAIHLSKKAKLHSIVDISCLLYTSPSPRDGLLSRMPSSA